MTKIKLINVDKNSKNSVYYIPCHCGKYYMGETCRALNVRVTEHKKNVRVANNGYSNNEKIIAKENKVIRRKLKESAYIQFFGDQCFSVEWLHLLKLG